MDIQSNAQTQEPQVNSITQAEELPSSLPTRQRPVTTHLAVLTAFILPITLLPYLVSRRQVSVLRRQVEELTAVTTRVQRDLGGVIAETAARKDDHRRVRGLLHDMMQETDEFKVQTEQRERARSTSDEEIRGELRKLLEEARRSRSQASTLKALGTSLAEVAAFMHEMELAMGLQGKRGRIEQLRLLALKMQDYLVPSDSKDKPDSKDSKHQPSNSEDDSPAI